MHVIMLEAAAGTFAYGPFPGKDAALGWFAEWSPALDGGVCQAHHFPIAEPFDLTGHHLALSRPHPAAPIRHTGRGGDDRARGFVVWLIDDTGGGLVGAFADRRAAAAWWRRQGRHLAPRVVATVVPVLPPQ